MKRKTKSYISFIIALTLCASLLCAGAYAEPDDAVPFAVSIAPDSVSAEDPCSIDVTVTPAGGGSAFVSGSITFFCSGSGRLLSAALNPGEDGSLHGSLGADGNSCPGTYITDSITLRDSGGGTVLYYNGGRFYGPVPGGSAVLALDASQSVPDGYVPGSGNITVSAQSADSAGMIYSLCVSFDGESDPAGGVMVFSRTDPDGEDMTVSLVPGPDKKLYSAAFFDANTTSGTFVPSRAEIADRDGNRAVYTGTGTVCRALPGSFPLPGFTVTNEGADTQPPVIDGIVPASSSVTAPGSLGITVSASDEGSEIRAGFVSFYCSASGTMLSAVLSQDDSGKLHGSIAVPGSAAPGTFELYGIYVLDSAGNYASYYPRFDEIQDKFADIGFSAERPAPADTEPPVLSGITLGSTSSGIPGSVDVSVSVSDNSSGAVSGEISFRCAQSSQSITAPLAQGDAGVLRGTLAVGSAVPAGTYVIERVSITDDAGNTAYYGSGPEGALIRTFPAECSELSVTAADVSAPELSGITLSSASVSAPGTVDITVSASDACSGVKDGSIVFSGTAGQFTVPLSLRSAGTLSGSAGITEAISSGVYTVSSVRISDNAGNTSEYGREQTSQARALPQNCLSLSLTVTDNPNRTVSSGSCGTGLSWELSAAGTLSISGSGAIPDFTNLNAGSRSPWYGSRQSVTSVVLGEGITSIGTGAFDGCAFTEINIPRSVTVISEGAFAQCAALRSITVSSGSTAFSSADGVLFSADRTRLACYPAGRTNTSYSIPSGVSAVLASAFRGSSLQNISIPDSVRAIGRGAFFSCSKLTAINVSGGNPLFSSADGILYNKGKTQISCYPAGKTASGFTVPDGTTSVGYGAFYGCGSLTSVSLPYSVRSIGYCAFEQCRNLRSITIPDSVTGIGQRAFADTGALTDVYYSGNAAKWNNMSVDAVGNDSLSRVSIHLNTDIPVSYTLRFNRNDASAKGTMADISGKTGSSAVIPECSFSCVGKKFDCWYTVSNGKTKAYAPGTPVKNLITRDGEVVVLYAKWTDVPAGSSGSASGGNTATYYTPAPTPRPAVTATPKPSPKPAVTPSPRPGLTPVTSKPTANLNELPSGEDADAEASPPILNTVAITDGNAFKAEQTRGSRTGNIILLIVIGLVLAGAVTVLILYSKGVIDLAWLEDMFSKPARKTPKDGNGQDSSFDWDDEE